MKKTFYTYFPLMLLINFTISFLNSIEDISSIEDFLFKVGSALFGSVIGGLVVLLVFEKLWDWYIKR